MNKLLEIFCVGVKNEMKNKHTSSRAGQGSLSLFFPVPKQVDSDECHFYGHSCTPSALFQSRRRRRNPDTKHSECFRKSAEQFFSSTFVQLSRILTSMDRLWPVAFWCLCKCFFSKQPINTQWRQAWRRCLPRRDRQSIHLSNEIASREKNSECGQISFLSAVSQIPYLVIKNSVKHLPVKNMEWLKAI